jgi:hypothetical protein
MRNLALNAAVTFVRVISAFTPCAVRARWTEEWLTELEHASHALRSRRFASLRLWAMACGAALDALFIGRSPRSSTQAQLPPRRVRAGFDHDRQYAMVIRQAMTLALTGAAIGGAATLAIGRIVRSEMHDLRGLDPVAFLGSAAILLLAMTIASDRARSRASRVDPVIVLRQDW